MIIKSPDDKQSQQTALQNLLHHPSADANIRKRIEQELRNMQAGIRGEEEAAYEMKVQYGESPNWMVIHDLRIEHGGLIAQIDHLLINRLLDMWVCESKHFSEGVAVNEHGEFAAFFGSRPYGVPSPVEQNNRHILILKRLFNSGAVNLPTRLGFTIKPDLKGLVLVSKGARISRPKAKIEGLDAIIKNDMLFKTINKAGEDVSTLIIAKVVSKETLETLAREIVSLHKPIAFNWHAKFGLAENPNRLPPVVAFVRPQVAQAQLNAQAVTTAHAMPATEAHDEQKVKQKLICNTCNEAVPYNVARFCWFNKPKFGGNVYCIECQKKTGNAKLAPAEGETQPPLIAAPVQPYVVQPELQAQSVNDTPAPAATELPYQPKATQKLICNTCNEAVPYNVAKFCWFNKPKFGGNVYCMGCQKNV